MPAASSAAAYSRSAWSGFTWKKDWGEMVNSSPISVSGSASVPNRCMQRPSSAWAGRRFSWQSHSDSSDGSASRSAGERRRMSSKIGASAQSTSIIAPARFTRVTRYFRWPAHARSSRRAANQRSAAPLSSLWSRQSSSGMTRWLPRAYAPMTVWPSIWTMGYSALLRVRSGASQPSVGRTSGASTPPMRVRASATT